jgi:4-hydroxy-tetrahydrodipicolinate synthase
LCVKQWQAFKQGDQSTAMQIQKMLNPVVSLYLERPFPAKIKELIQLQGRNAGIARRPTLPSDPEVLEIMKRALAGAGLRVLQA